MTAYIHYISLTRRWVAYSRSGKVIAQSESKTEVINACSLAGYKVEEA